MWNALIVLALALTALTRLVTLYTGVSASAYLALVPLFLASVFALLTIPQRHKFLQIDLAMGILVLLPVGWVLFGLMAAGMTSPNYPMTQFFKQIIWSLLVYSPYFALRYAPSPNPSFVFWAFCTIVTLSIPVIYLQQVGVLTQFETVQSERFLSSYLDATGLRRYRNTGFFGYTHDAGQALLLLSIALYAGIASTRSRTVRRLAVVLMPFTLIALILTSSRTSLFQMVLALLSGALLIDPIVKGTRGAPARNLTWLVGLSAMLVSAIWVANELDPDLLSTTLLFTKGFLSPFTGEGRLSTTLTTLGYLLSDPVRAAFGWGLGSGGLAVVQGQSVLPVNTVDQSVTILLSNFGLIGLTIIVGCLSYVTVVVIWIHRHLTSLAQAGKCDAMLPVVSHFCLLAMVIATLSSASIGESVINRVFCNFLFLCLGALVNRYEMLTARTKVPSVARANVAPRPA